MTVQRVGSPEVIRMVGGAPVDQVVMFENTVWRLTDDAPIKVYESGGSWHPLAAQTAPNGQLIAVLERGTLGERSSDEGTPMSGTPQAGTPVVNGTPESATPKGATPITEAAGDRMELAVLKLDVNGEERGRVTLGLSHVGDGMYSLDWSPTGDDVLVSHGGRDLIIVSANGDARTVAVPHELTSVRDARWAPNGQAVTFLARQEATPQLQLYFATLYADGLDPVRIAPVDGRSDRTIVAYDWMPGTERLLYTDAMLSGGLMTGRDVFAIDLSGQDRRLIVAAGTVAPVAGVDRFAPAPDGSVIAFTLVVPTDDADGEAFGGLWVQSLADNALVKIPTSGTEAITDLWWTAEGLVWRSVDDDGERLLLADGHGPTRELLNRDAERSGSGTPVATVDNGTPAVGTPAV